MPSITKEVFDKFAQYAIVDISQNMKAVDAVATAKTLRSLAFVSSDSRLVMTGGKAFTGTDRLSFIESGRGSSKRDEGGVLYPAILEWCIARGIGTPKTREQKAKTITYFIHKRGTQLHQQQKIRDVVQSTFGEDRIAQLYKELGNVLFRDLESQIVKQIREGASIR